MTDYRTDHRLGRLVRLRDPNAASTNTARWLDGVTTAVDEELSNDSRLSRKYYVCLGAFTSSDEAMAHFCELEARGRVIPCVNHPVDLAALERIGHVMYVDDLPHPALAAGWREEDSRREMLLLPHRRTTTTIQRHEVADLRAVTHRNAEEQERRRLQVVAAAVAGLRSSPFYPVLPNAPSRHLLDEMCLRAMAPVRLAVLPSGDVAVDDAGGLGSGATVCMRSIVQASKAYEADVAMFLLELAFVKNWAQRMHGSVQAARDAWGGIEEGEGGVRAGAGQSSSAAVWMRDATALSRFDRGVMDTIRNCLLG